MSRAPSPVARRETIRMTRRATRLVMPLVAAGLVAGCATEPAGSMVSIRPPDRWVERLVEGRSTKDEYYRTNPETPLLAEDIPGFEGLDYWDPDPTYYFVGQVHLYLAPERFEVATTSGVVRPCEKVGWLAITLDRREQRLQIYRLLDQSPGQGGGDFFVPFMDGTTGEETYPAGRYIDLQGPEGGPYVLDFNTASNPWCAYGAAERYVCPVTPPENRLAIRIEAGERGYRRGAADPG